MPRALTTKQPSRRTDGLAQIANMLASARDVRTELVSDIRGQMDGGAYLSDEKLNLAIYRMLRNILE